MLCFISLSLFQLLGIVNQNQDLYPILNCSLFLFFSEDADKLRLHTFSEAGDMDSLEKMVNGSDSEDSSEDSSDAA